MVDVVITNALILDHWGIVKADIGIKHGRIVGIGKAGNPDTQAGVTIRVELTDPISYNIQKITNQKNFFN